MSVVAEMLDNISVSGSPDLYVPPAPADVVTPDTPGEGPAEVLPVALPVTPPAAAPVAPPVTPPVAPPVAPPVPPPVALPVPPPV